MTSFENVSWWSWMLSYGVDCGESFVDMGCGQGSMQVRECGLAQTSKHLKIIQLARLSPSITYCFTGLVNPRVAFCFVSNHRLIGAIRSSSHGSSADQSLAWSKRSMMKYFPRIKVGLCHERLLIIVVSRSCSSAEQVLGSKLISTNAILNGSSSFWQSKCEAQVMQACWCWDIERRCSIEVM